MRDWRRRMGSGDNDVGGLEKDAEMIAAYFDLHGLSSSTGLIIERMDHVCTFQTKRLFFFLRLSVSLFSFSLLEDGLEPRA
jgi:hypothetical protein